MLSSLKIKNELRFWQGVVRQGSFNEIVFMEGREEDISLLFLYKHKYHKCKDFSVTIAASLFSQTTTISEQLLGTDFTHRVFMCEKS